MGALQYDLTGKRFGDWKVISYAGRSRWKAKCKCGAVHNVIAWNLSSGHTTRCNVCRKKAEWKHGQAGQPYRKPASRAYSTWQGMLRRCRTPGSAHYADYGGRGIKVCRRWETFVNFFSDMGAKPKGMTLERRRTNGNYTPSNCYWATQKMQANNKRNNRRIVIGGETKTLAQWCDHYGIGYACAFGRLKRGTDPETAFTAKTFEVGANVRWLTIGGVKRSVTSWAKQLGVRPGLIFCRLNAGWSPKKAVLTPVTIRA